MNNEPAITVNGQKLKKTWMQIMHTVLKLAQLRWIGHILIMYDERLPKKKKRFLWRTTGVKAFSRWSEETLQRHDKDLSEGLRHNRVLGKDCTGAIKVVRSHQQRSSSI